MFLYYTHTPYEAKVSLTENINIHAYGGEFDGLYISLSAKNSCKKKKFEIEAT